jgi:hypothetical protein
MITTPNSERIVRTLIPDVDAIYGEDKNEYLFTPQQISDFLAAGGGNVLKAAGFAMITVGNSEAMIEKVIRTQDLTTDGSKLQQQWRESGLALLARGDKETDAENVFDGFQIIDYREGWAEWPPELTEQTWV